MTTTPERLRCEVRDMPTLGDTLCNLHYEEQEHAMTKHPTDEQFRKAASKQYHKDGEVEIDQLAPVSRADGNPDGGAYVQAWVWVYDEDATP